ncbi:unnamed protein product [Adineta steineri]|uniref:Uncharacterized protein n=1 Tax=Adineta steineri TaxID=433720 RepID=A0A815JM83_9BILA|nr:unnamed protein product [Adineta steineri]CAF1381827.1 unnamed protein product [Adineta steineri]
MPADGLCTDLTCDKEIKHLYECHCCLSLICFQHLSEHVEAAQRNKERLVSLRNELKTDVGTLINLTEQAQKLLDVENGSIDEVQIIFEEIKQAIGLSQFEGIIKLEPTLPNTKSCSCICKCGNQNDELLSKTTPPPSNRSLVHQNLTVVDETNGSMMTTDDEHSMCDTSVIVDGNSPDRTTASIEDSDDENEQNKVKSIAMRSVHGSCPLTFDGAYGLTAANHSMHFCSNKPNRSLVLYSHFLGKHELQPIYARRLVNAFSNNEDPKTTKLFSENEHVINHLCKIPCPFNKNMIHLFRGSTKDIHRIPCYPSRMAPFTLVRHLQNYHHVTDSVARKLVDKSKRIRIKNLK